MSSKYPWWAEEGLTNEQLLDQATIAINLALEESRKSDLKVKEMKYALIEINNILDKNFIGYIIIRIFYSKFYKTLLEALKI